jgi:hypothetical protein
MKIVYDATNKDLIIKNGTDNRSNVTGTTASSCQLETSNTTPQEMSNNEQPRGSPHNVATQTTSFFDLFTANNQHLRCKGVKLLSNCFQDSSKPAFEVIAYRSLVRRVSLRL